MSGVRAAAWSLRGVGFYALAGLFALLALAPLAILFKVSISGPEDVLVQHPPFWVYHPTLEHWQAILKPDVLFLHHPAHDAVGVDPVMPLPELPRETIGIQQR